MGSSSSYLLISVSGTMNHFSPKHGIQIFAMYHASSHVCYHVNQSFYDTIFLKGVMDYAFLGYVFDVS